MCHTPCQSGTRAYTWLAPQGLGRTTKYGIDAPAVALCSSTQTTHHSCTNYKYVHRGETTALTKVLVYVTQLLSVGTVAGSLIEL